MNKVLEDIKNEKEYYEGLNEALYPDYTEIHGLMGDDGYSKEEYILYQQLIKQNPTDERLLQALKTDEDGLFLLCFFHYPLERVIGYTFSNCLTIAAEQLMPPKYELYDAESICKELSKLKMLGRERIFNYYYDIDYRYSEKLRHAIMEPNVEIMRELLESKAIDLLWMQRTLGVMKYGVDLVDGVVNKTISEEDGDNLYGDFIKSLVDDEVPYINDYFRIATNEEFEGISITDVWGLYLKYYWYIYHSFRKKTRTIIDAYINKPCFEEFVSKCRAEFDEDERLRQKGATEAEEHDEKGYNNSLGESTKKETTKQQSPRGISKKGSWLKTPKELEYEGKLGLKIQDEIWPPLYDRACRLKYYDIKGSNKEKQIKYLSAIFINHAAVSLGCSNPLSDNAASSFERVLSFENINRQTLRKYEEMMEAYDILLEQHYYEYSTDHEGNYYDPDSNATIYHGGNKKSTNDFMAKYPDLAKFLSHNFDDITEILDWLKPQLKAILSLYR